jgi:hypothetical protein
MQVVVHYEAFKTAGARVTFREFDFGHLDFTFGVRRLDASELGFRIELPA